MQAVAATAVNTARVRCPFTIKDKRAQQVPVAMSTGRIKVRECYFPALLRVKPFQGDSDSSLNPKTEMKLTPK